MRSRHKLLLIILCAFVSMPFLSFVFSQETMPFIGEVNTDNINIRSDSTVSSEIICNVNKGNRVEVILGLYGWYKIRLPKNAPSFIKKSLVTVIEDKPANSFDKLQGNIEGVQNAKVLKNRVNIRLHPNESSPILGRVNKNELIYILEDKGDWYKIEPVNNSFGWINKRFISKVSYVDKIDDIKPLQKIEEKNKAVTQDNASDQSITIEGIVRPYGMIIKRIATHKLIAQDSKTFLLKGDKKSLDTLNYHKVKVTGKIISSSKQKYPLIEIITVEVID